MTYETTVIPRALKPHFTIRHGLLRPVRIDRYGENNCQGADGYRPGIGNHETPLVEHHELPLMATSRHSVARNRSLLYPQQQTFWTGLGMSQVVKGSRTPAVAEHPRLRGGRIWITRMSTFCSKRWVAKQCLSVCRERRACRCRPPPWRRGRLGSADGWSAD